MKKKTKYHFGVQCAQCKKRMFSYSRHDYKICGCPNETMVDGGFNYLRFGWMFEQPRRIRHTEKLDGKLPKIGVFRNDIRRNLRD